jgi:Flp pilus assembly protein TadG
MTMSLRSRLRNEDGQGVVEFALVAPLLFALLIGIIQFGITFNNYLTLTDATRVGARKAAVSRLFGDGVTSGRAATIAAASNLTLTPAQVTVSATSWTIPGSDVSVTASYPYSINILGWVVKSGNITSSTHERLE